MEDRSVVMCLAGGRPGQQPIALRIAEEAEASERDIARRIAETPLARLIKASEGESDG
jgi:hypothetical protein